jgi:hypothetical protein
MGSEVVTRWMTCHNHDNQQNVGKVHFHMSPTQLVDFLPKGWESAKICIFMAFIWGQGRGGNTVTGLLQQGKGNPVSHAYISTQCSSFGCKFFTSSYTQDWKISIPFNEWTWPLKPRNFIHCILRYILFKKNQIILMLLHRSPVCMCSLIRPHYMNLWKRPEHFRNRPSRPKCKCCPGWCIIFSWVTHNVMSPRFKIVKV